MQKRFIDPKTNKQCLYDGIVDKVDKVDVDGDDKVIHVTPFRNFI